MTSPKPNFITFLQNSPFLSDEQKALFVQVILAMQCSEVQMTGELAPNPEYTGKDIDRSLHTSKWQRHEAYETGEGNPLPGLGKAQITVNREFEILYK